MCSLRMRCHYSRVVAERRSQRVIVHLLCTRLGQGLVIPHSRLPRALADAWRTNGKSAMWTRAAPMARRSVADRCRGRTVVRRTDAVGIGKGPTVERHT
jgi:hypothetical protein